MRSVLFSLRSAGIWAANGRFAEAFQSQKAFAALLSRPAGGSAFLGIFLFLASLAQAQVNVVTQHNDIARTGQNLSETILTPATVGGGSFGKLFSQVVTGQVNAQPLYVSQVTIPGKGVHNVVYVATESNGVYAFDADSNGGVDASALWQISLDVRSPASAAMYNRFGVVGTPVIDLTTNTMYLVSSDTISATSITIHRLHALDITTGLEKFGGPVQISGSVPGTGSGSSGGVMTFDSQFEFQRPGLLLLNGVLYIAFGGVDDNGAWHGWLFSYNDATLVQIDLLCTTPNGSGGGIWMGGAGLAAEVYNPAKPYGRLFLTTGNGSFTASPPYTSGMSYAMSVLDFDLTGGEMTLEDEFTPYDWNPLNAHDGDLGSGGPVLLPAQTLASGQTLHPLVQAGKSGLIYVLDRDNNADGSNNPATEYSPAGLGGFNLTADQIVQEVQTPEITPGGWGAGVWGSEAYWNNNIYYGGIRPGVTGNLVEYSFINGVLSAAPTSQTSEPFSYPGPTPSISANGTTTGIVWVLTHAAQVSGAAVLQAYDATNLASLLYSSNTDFARDNPGTFEEFNLPTIANGKVYAGTSGEVSIFGLLSTTQTVAPPVITPPGATFTGSQSVALSDATPGAQIYYTTNGSTPTVASSLYTAPIAVTSSETITAIASATGYLQGSPVSASFSSTSNAANPLFSLAAGNYSGSQSLTITDSSSGAAIYYTVDGTTPTTASSVYSAPISVSVSEIIQAIATAPGLQPSSVVSAAYSITPAYQIAFPQGFANAQILGQMQFNGSTDLDDYRMQLTNGGFHEAGSAFYTTPVNVQSFTTDFTFQLSNPVGDGMTFTIQGVGPAALGSNAAGLGYAGISKSVAIKFDMYNDGGQGSDSTGMYKGGVSPVLPSIDLSKTGIDLHSGDYMNVHVTYDGTLLNLTITDAVTLATWSTTFVVNIPYHVGGNTAYVGFTGSTGGSSSSQKVTYWTYLAGQPPTPSYPVGFDSIGLNTSGSAALSTATLQLTNGGLSEVASTFYAIPVGIDAFTTDFDFTIGAGTSAPVADGLCFVIQNAGARAIGGAGGSLGYASIPKSVAIKFDIFNNAGEGVDSTGVYIDGATPTIPAISLLPSGLQLASGAVIHAHITYDGTTLSWYIHDVTNGESATEQLAINIPHTVGSNTAFVGFTAASGDGTALQEIFDWTFTNQ